MTIIFLNGASSSGKTTIAKELQAQIEEPYLHMSIDSFLDTMMTWYGLASNDGFEEVGLGRLFSMFLHSIEAFAKTGSNQIIDNVLGQFDVNRECIDLLAGYDAYFVKVHCPLDELERREKQRSDRKSGQARRQVGNISTGTFDIEIDTSILPPSECAAKIRTEMEEKPARAFKELALVKNK